MLALVVGGSPVAAAVAGRLRSRGVGCREVDAARAGDLRWEVGPGSCRVDGDELGALFLHARPRALGATGFVAGDDGFAAAEVSSAVVAACHLPEVLAINRLDAEVWFEDAGPHVLARRLPASTATPMTYGAWPPRPGAAWRPYWSLEERRAPAPLVARALGAALGPAGSLGRPWAFACGEPLQDDAPEAAARAARALWGEGVGLVELHVDGEGRIGAVDAAPPLVEPAVRERAAERIAEAIGDHLRPR